MSNMIRHTWVNKDKEMDITVLICQRKTPDVTKLCLESLLRWYPSIKVLVVDGDSKDESSTYLAMKQSLYSNVRVHTFTGERHSHGEIMHMAMSLITTSKVLLMDSDVVTMRPEWIEQMYSFRGYAIGTLMEVGIKAEGCGPAESEEDTVSYAHPSLSMIDREMYFTLEPFKDHGAPCISNMVDAKQRGYIVSDFPVEEYTLHLSGSSWTAPRTVWWHDNDVMVRPMLSIIGGRGEYQGNDIEMIPIDRTPKRWESIITWDMKPISDYDVNMFNIRFNVMGEYVVISPVTQEQVDRWRDSVVKGWNGDIEVDGINFMRRKMWQKLIVDSAR